ncbi:hypothetical protein [Pontibacter sp. G13]|uniref:hypothetical protein n=1 Tax=Pontibacter sp. G13 TaxID=3074898 RepID=UPI0028896B89|nr:hypothetical protein [Pontibacter sp. G13]WNJ19859.1 hypothetical protein RJD25_05195 [Pontibacter sp. G13]
MDLGLGYYASGVWGWPLGLFGVYLHLMEIEQIERVYIKLEMDGKSVLSLLLSASGAVNRMGDGSGDKSVSKFAMGRVDEPLFAQFMDGISPELFDLAGRYEMPDPKGKPCYLEMSFEGEDIDTGIAFSFGSQSDGPPEDLMNLVELAVELTDPWYDEYLTKGNPKRK